MSGGKRLVVVLATKGLLTAAVLLMAEKWNQTRDQAVQLYLPFAPPAEAESCNFFATSPSKR